METEASLLCLFCPTPLTEDTHLEHPVLKRIGGRLQRRDLICDDCNEEIAAAADTPLAVELAHLCHALWVRSGDNDDPPTLKAVATEEHGVIDLMPGGMRKTKIDWPTLVPDGAGGVTAKLDARSLDETALQIAHLARRNGIKTFEQLEKSLRLPDEMVVQKKPLTKPINLQFGLGNPEHFRSIAKSAIEILAVHDAGAARGADLEPLRRWIRDDDGHERAGWSFADELPLPFSQDELGEFPHVVSVWAETGSPMAARVTFFGHFHFFVLMADAWSGKPVAISYAVDPLAEVQHSVREFAVRPPPATLTDLPMTPPDPVLFQERYLLPFFMKAHPIGRQRNIAWLVRERVWAVLGDRSSTEPLTDAELAQLDVVTDDLIKTVGRVEQRQTIDRDELMRKVREALGRLAKND